MSELLPWASNLPSYLSVCVPLSWQVLSQLDIGHLGSVRYWNFCRQSAERRAEGVVNLVSSCWYKSPGRTRAKRADWTRSRWDIAKCSQAGAVICCRFQKLSSLNRFIADVSLRPFTVICGSSRSKRSIRVSFVLGYFWERADSFLVIWPSVNNLLSLNRTFFNINISIDNMYT